MPREIAVLGTLVPTLVPVFLATGMLMLFLDRLFARAGVYAKVWHPALFRAAIFASIFSGIGLYIY
ncbi:MAG: DUF1656 domain-containing protein [Betaproteobacteria bacterium]|nr:DUF1656 domain-containing protein [Betaproteobacteria bacterium]MDE2622459.1 DUF1656 domain-containing protein [Betaproteobacteria bacterium]